MERLKVLNRNQIKYIVIVAMLIDHIAWAFVPVRSPQGLTMHFIGRLTGPTMAYYLADGFIHTHSRPKYAMRLAIFALISWLPYSLFEKRAWPTTEFSVMYTLLLGFIAVWVWNNEKIAFIIRLEVVAGLLILSAWGDWSFMDVFIPLLMVRYKDDEEDKWLSLTIMCVVWALMGFVEGIHIGIMQCGLLLVPILLKFFYSGQPGSRHPFHKWFFYIFYPAHLLILALIKYNTIRICGAEIPLPWK